MKKRILSIVLALCMVMAIMPQAVFANSNEDSLPEGDLSWEYDVWIGGTPVTRSQLAGPGWLFDPDTYTLTLRPGFTSSGTANLQDSTERAAVIYVKSDHSLTIELEGDATIGTAGWENALTADSKQVYGIYALSSNITITGSHTLNVYGSDTAVWCKCLTVDGTKLNCRSYYTAVKVCSDSDSYFIRYSLYEDSLCGEDNMVVKNEAEVFAKTTHGLGIHPVGVFGSHCYRFLDCGGGAGIFVNGSLTVENSTIDAENTCYELPAPIADSFNGVITSFCRAKTFCTSICVHDDVVVSGSNARVTGKLENKADNFGEGGTLYSKLGAVMANNFKVREGGTIEGFITSDYFTQVAQGLRQLDWFRKYGDIDLNINPASISLDGEGTVRNGINRMQSVAYLGTEEFQYTDIGPYVFKEDTTATSGYSCYREVMITQSSGIYFRTTDNGQEWSFQSDFRKAYPLDSKIIDFRDFSNTVFVEKGWPAGGLIPYIYIQSGDWTVLPSTDRNANSYLEAGSSLTVQYENGQTYRGGYAHVAEGATLKIQGDGISEYWNVMPYEFYDKTGGTVRFINGTVAYAQVEKAVSIYIEGGNINLYPKYLQVVKNGNGRQLFKCTYDMSDCPDTLTGLVFSDDTVIKPEDCYFYLNNGRFATWTPAGTSVELKYVWVNPENGDSYRLIKGDTLDEDDRIYAMKRPGPYWKLKANGNYRHYKTPEDSVTMNAGVIQTLEQWEGQLDPHIVSESATLPENLRAEWSYQNDNGEKVVVGGNSLTCTINDLSDIVGSRTYTCTVYQKVDDGSESEIGSYSSVVYVMRWKPKEVFYATPGQDITLTAEPSEECTWAEHTLQNFKWQVNKGAGWEDISGATDKNYTFTASLENAGWKYRRVSWGFLIGAFNRGEANIYVEFTTPELSITFVPEITAQPQGLTIHEKNTTEHSLSVTAENAESYRWQKKADGAFVDIEGATSSTLKVGPQDAGTYRCVVKNAYGETVSEEASVTMHPAPSCSTLSEVKAKLGTKAEFGVTFSNVSGDGSVQIKWQYSTDDGATWVDVVSTDPSDNISMFYIAIQFGYKPIGSPGSTTIISSRIDGATMTINKTTADMDGWKVRCVLTDAVGVYYSNAVELSVEMPNYTVTFNTDGGTEITSKTTVQWTDTVLNGITAPTKDGWKFIGWKYGDITVTPQTTYKELAADAAVTSIELKAQWEDITAPTGEISIGTNSWKAFLNKITFGLFFKDTKTVTVTASDNSGGEVTVSYLLSDKALTADNLAEKEFTAYTGGFDIEPNNEWIIYVMLTDKAGNVTYLSSYGIALDNVAPVISGVENGKIYCGAQTVTVDEKYIDSVTVNGKEITLQNNQFTLPAAEGTQKIVATDKAGNVSAEITVTVNDGHTDKNKDHACDHGCDVAIGVHEDKNKDHKCEYCGEEVTSCKDDDKDHLCDICDATLSEHTGGEATCKDKAVCDYCGKEYGDFDSDKHTGGTEIRDAKAESCTETGYTGDTFCVGCGEKLSEGEVIPKLSHKDKDKDHLCDVCRIRLSEHTGGTATCTEKAVCEYCHKEYGEPKGHNYTESIIAPTEFTLGGTKHTCSNCGDEYWYNFTKEDTSYKLVIPGGKTLYEYLPISEEPEIAVKVELDNPVVSVFLQDPLGTLKRMEDDGIKLYKITEGAEQVVERSDKKIVFRSDAPFDEFDQVMINGLVLDKKYYSVKKGSTIVTLNEDFAKQIPTGMHLFGIISKDGVAITTFTVDDKAEDNDTDSPQTGDNSQMALWIALLFVSGAVVIGTTGYGKKKREE